MNHLRAAVFCPPPDSWYTGLMSGDESVEGRSDVIIIGSGPGGEGAAMQAAKNGKTVAVIEQ